MDMNEKLAKLRKAKGLTQKELAETLHVSRQAISRWEVGTAAPSLDNLAYLSQLYGVPLEQCAAVGDSGNDLEALRAVGMPIAMGNASQAVKDAALRVVSSNRKEGAAQAVLSCLE